MYRRFDLAASKPYTREIAAADLSLFTVRNSALDFSQDLPQLGKRRFTARIEVGRGSDAKTVRKGWLKRTSPSRSQNLHAPDLSARLYFSYKILYTCCLVLP